MKLKRSTLLVFLQLAISTFAQSQDSLKTGRWQIGLNFSPDYCHRILSVAPDQKNVEHEARGHSKKIAYTTGIGVKYQLSKKSYLETGLFYTDKGMKSMAILVGYKNGLSTIDELRFYHTYDYLEIPIKWNVHFRPERKVHGYLSLGAAAEVLLGARMRAVSGYGRSKKVDNMKLETEDCSPVNVALCIGYGWDMAINKRVSVVIQPSYTQFLIQQFLSEKIKEHLYAVGLKVGVYYRLKSKTS